MKAKLLIFIGSVLLAAYALSLMDEQTTKAEDIRLDPPETLVYPIKRGVYRISQSGTNPPELYVITSDINVNFTAMRWGAGHYSLITQDTIYNQNNQTGLVLMGNNRTDIFANVTGINNVTVGPNAITFTTYDENGVLSDDLLDGMHFIVEIYLD